MITTLIIIAFICFVVSAFNVATPVNLVAAGLAFLTASMLVGAHIL